jgi:predicted ABC-type sugar transport system permease subunit
MSTMFLSLYLLIWPLIVATVLAVIVYAFGKEWQAARKAGRPLM